ncbi:hypothetical protein ACTFQF_12155 [Aliivibrio fischeri]|uniref:hypothetical protein n=1 Tax=Aliivibrio fischeri TaxID=668 RepID=UPI0007C56AE5|nr:hypothetical protein [Aliivibrio fischeri]MBP3141863.1 hypothetical protein [Aliivibrio fischeri]MBP3141868.1 hypothetical protein [Aliivibrio fischeri]MBP3155200.1 hypothetical protein [Aliivibrio fischeri]MBP3157503.1 hypothetical protein [Aliivibrio fischeri]MBP3157508.1 hypothetical protein [Aliivibrio fischeri]
MTSKIEDYRSEQYLDECRQRGRSLSIKKGYKIWTQADDILLVNMYKDNLSIAEISTSVGHPYSSCLDRLKRLGVSRRVSFYSRSDVRYLSKYYGIKPLSEIASHLGRTNKQLRDKAYKLGLGARYIGSNHQFSKHSDDDIELIRQLDDIGMSHSDIADKMETNRSYVTQLVNFKYRKCLTPKH